MFGSWLVITDHRPLSPSRPWSALTDSSSHRLLVPRWYAARAKPTSDNDATARVSSAAPVGVRSAKRPRPCPGARDAESVAVVIPGITFHEQALPNPTK